MLIFRPQIFSSTKPPRPKPNGRTKRTICRNTKVETSAEQQLHRELDRVIGHLDEEVPDHIPTGHSNFGVIPKTFVKLLG